jgi:hypothetical protein
MRKPILGTQEGSRGVSDVLFFQKCFLNKGTFYTPIPSSGVQMVACQCPLINEMGKWFLVKEHWQLIRQSTSPPALWEALVKSPSQLSFPI